MPSAAPRRRIVVAALLAAAAMAVVAVVAVVVPGTAAAQSTRERLERARVERAALEERVAETAVALEDLAARIDQTDDERRGLERRVRQLEDRAEESTEDLTTIAQEQYRARGGDPLVDLLESGDTGDALARARVLDGVGRTDREAIERAAAARGSLRRARAELEDVEVELDAERERVQELAAQLDTAFGDAVAEEQELASRRDRQREISRDGMDGTYACLIGAPYTFRDTWGAPRSGGRSHKGVDVFAEMGEDVYAVTDGEVSRISTSPLGGLGLYVQGDDGNEYYYAHLRSVRRGYQPGRRVEAGELVAANGDSGNARGGAPHVHFEVHPGGGAPVNPYPYTAAACF